MLHSNSAPDLENMTIEGCSTTDVTSVLDDSVSPSDISSSNIHRSRKTAGGGVQKDQTHNAEVGSGSDDSMDLDKNDNVSIDGSNDEDGDDDDDLDHHMTGGGSWGKGIQQDVKNTIGKYWCQEMTNFDQKTVAVSFFIFFAAISPAITFGAIYAKATNNYIGAVEMITATAWCGIVYALIGGQPLMINGGTGPVLAFTEIIYKMSKSIDVPFLTFNAWVGVWVSIYMIAAAVFDLNRIIVHATRFTDEIFALLIAAIFIVNALGNPFGNTGLYHYFRSDHPSHIIQEEIHDDPDTDYSHMATALLSVIVCIGTVQLAMELRKTKFSSYGLNQTMRNVVTDFAVVTSIAFWTIVSTFIFPTVQLETLNVPDTFAPTFECCTEACDKNWPEQCPDLDEPFGRRPWKVDMMDFGSSGKAWVPFMAAGPAILAFILVFLDDGITWHLINHPSHKITHGSAYNYDTLVIGVMVLINSLFGLPWLVAATVRSLNHVHALAEKKPNGKIVSVKETRLTHLGIHLLCFISIFALHILKVIPMPVLYGVFLFMGLVSLGTNQFWGRFQMMFFMQPSKYPIEPYTQFMKPKRMHIYTTIQLFLFLLLYFIKSFKPIAIAFPIIIALCIPVRLYLLPCIFTKEELLMIDSDEETVRRYLKKKKEIKKKMAKNNQAMAEDDEEMQKQQDDHANSHYEGADRGEEENELAATTTTTVVFKRGDVDEEHRDESDDVVLGLPTNKDLSKEVRRSQRRRNTRKKSVSCPENMLFVEALEAIKEEGATAAGGGNQDQNKDDDQSTANSSTTDDGIGVAGAGATVGVVPLEERITMRRRRRKSQTLSCPAHMLFAEADRHLNSNYFFG